MASSVDKANEDAVGAIHVMARVPGCSDNESVWMVLVSQGSIVCLSMTPCSKTKMAVWTLPRTTAAIRMAEVKPQDGMLAVLTTDKEFLLLSLPELSLAGAVSGLPKKPTVVAWTPDASKVLLADKAGGCYCFPVEALPKSPAEVAQCLLVGHLGAITSMAVSSCGRFLVTADKNEKIRVSRFPNSYHIEAFALGHRDFISSVRLSQDDRHLVSASGDGTLRLWDFPSCLQRDSLSFPAALAPALDHPCAVPVILDLHGPSATLAVKFDGSPTLALLSIRDSAFAGLHTITLPHEAFAASFSLDGASLAVSLATFPRSHLLEFHRRQDSQQWLLSPTLCPAFASEDSCQLGPATAATHAALLHDLSPLRYQKYDSKSVSGESTARNKKPRGHA